MGLESTCQCRYGREVGEGRLDLESGKLRFRGSFRLDISLAAAQRVEARGAWLEVDWPAGSAAFELGAAAARKWADKILHPPSVLDKLGVASGRRVAMVGVFEEAFHAEVTRVVTPAARLAAGQDLVLLSAAAPKDLDRVSSIANRYLAEAGALWIIYPKGRGQAISEAMVREAARAAGLVDTKVCSFSDTLTATKWVKPRATRQA